MKLLRARPGMHYAPIDGGVYFSSARATFVMRGPAVLFRVVDACLPRLEDGTDVEELVEMIGAPSARPLVTHLVDTLDSRGLVLHLDQLLVPEPSDAERERFPEALAYLETFRDQPYADFRRVRQARVVLAGPPEALGPAARGLLRAGVGQVMVATPEPERLAGLASRHPEVRLLVNECDGFPTLVGGAMPHAAVIFTDDTFPADTIQRLPASCLAVPVRLGKDLAIVGPAMRPRESQPGVETLWTRAVTWSRRDGDELLVRPSGDLLAGALAGQVALDALIGLNPGRVHLVHGPDLSSDSITPPLSTAAEYDPTIDFAPPGWLTSASHASGAGAARARPATGLATPSTGGGRDEAANHRAWLDDVSGRWAGLFRVHVPGDLPQMPLALTLADGRTSGFDGRVVGFGPDQEASTTEAALEALRRHSAGRRRSPGQELPGGPAAAAAGLDQTRWLLDGALRIAADLPGDERVLDEVDIDDLQGRRLWRALEQHELTPVRLVARQVPGFSWTLVSVHDRRSGARLAGGWGTTDGAGAVGALSASVATLQVRRTIDPGFQPTATAPGFIEHRHGAHVDELAAAVGRWLDRSGCHLRGQRLRRDSVAGPLGAWCGMVWIGG